MNFERMNQPAFAPEYTEAIERIRKCKDYYEILGVNREAKDTEIREAYKTLALQLHPDKNYCPGATQAFAAIGNAVDTLTDPEKRKLYNTSIGFEKLYCCRDILQSDLNVLMFILGFFISFLLILYAASFSMSNKIYSKSESSKYPVSRVTTNLKVPYYVTENFDRDHKGSVQRLEIAIEEDHLVNLRHACERELCHKETVVLRALKLGDRKQFHDARNLLMPSCEKLFWAKRKKYGVWFISLIGFGICMCIMRFLFGAHFVIEL